jgi:DNA processing protein
MAAGEEERIGLLRLNLTGGIGARLYRRLLDRFGSLDAVFRANPGELTKIKRIGPVLAGNILRKGAEEEARDEERRAKEKGLKILTLGQDGFPRALEDLFDPPLVLYVLGDMEEGDADAVAVVGARDASHYGLSQSERFARGLASRGITVVSGMARGIDSAAHRGALKAGGRTLAILGSGFSHLYPAENTSLAGKIAQSGAVISEFPLDAAPLKPHFPRRNRIISGLALGVLVIEAARRSGSLITVDWALEQGREVFALPGRVDMPGSRGVHRLIKQGAHMVEDPEDILEILGFSCMPGEGGPVAPEGLEELSPLEEKIFALLTVELTNIEQIVDASELPVSLVYRALTNLEVRRLVRQYPGKNFVRLCDPRPPARWGAACEPDQVAQVRR